jgi:hypothetical protein
MNPIVLWVYQEHPIGMRWIGQNRISFALRIERGEVSELHLVLFYPTSILYSPRSEEASNLVFNKFGTGNPTNHTFIGN